MLAIKVKRIYDPSEKSDGFRILVDRLWPRGIKKEDAGIDLWDKEIAPSNELRHWFNHDPHKWSQFRKLYEKELIGKSQLAELIKTIRGKTITLLYSAKDTEHNNAVALKDIITKLK
jgi:uncharacterized protein YeaO (DUF488 family)